MSSSVEPTSPTLQNLSELIEELNKPTCNDDGFYEVGGDNLVFC